MAEDLSPSGELSLDRARELLIGISESQPENLIDSQSGEEPTNVHDNASVTSPDKAEEFRSKLISISCVPSPETIPLPANGHM